MSALCKLESENCTLQRRKWREIMIYNARYGCLGGDRQTRSVETGDWCQGGLRIIPYLAYIAYFILFFTLKTSFIISRFPCLLAILRGTQSMPFINKTHDTGFPCCRAVLFISFWSVACNVCVLGVLYKKKLQWLICGHTLILQAF